MPLISSGAISLGRSASTTATNSASHRLGQTAGTTVSMNDSVIRSLAEVSSTSATQWSLSSLYDKPSWAYTANYNCSSFTDWTPYPNTSGSSSSHKTNLWPSVSPTRWRMFADGSEISYVYQTRSFDLATSFDLLFDVMTDTTVDPLQIGICNNSTLGGPGFAYRYDGLYLATFNNNNMASTSLTFNGSQGAKIISWYDVCAGGTSRQAIFTRLRFVGTRSGSTWSGTVTALTTSDVVIGSSSFSFTSSGNYLVVRSYSSDDNGETGDNTSTWVDNILVTVD